MSSPRVSIVVPTYNRRRLLAGTLPPLLSQEPASIPYEIVVVVDGSRDGTVEMLREIQGEGRLRFVTQENRGLAAARNRGAREGRGEIVLFLDDDMIAPPNLVSGHLEAHARPGERVVFGGLGLAPAVRRSFLKDGVESWGAEIDARLSSPGYRFRFDDCHFGHASISKSLFLRAGGFDESFVKFGNEDYELGWRLIGMEAEMSYLGRVAVGQVYDKTFGRWLEDCYSVGRADVDLQRKHRALAADLRLSRREPHPLKRFARWSSLLAVDFTAPAWAAAELAMAGMERAGARGRALGHVQSLLGERRYWKGIRDARRAAAPVRRSVGEGRAA
ncbi:MAG TPA: glycosyltransferase [Candidatus Polarisedimenticolia bacterium]|jgi:glycosyltransferase involved in cell wall biosynthesis|nr:glycosyltransferase [Candidatus Polarisedimenticolia bacterium]